MTCVRTIHIRQHYNLPARKIAHVMKKFMNVCLTILLASCFSSSLLILSFGGSLIILLCLCKTLSKKNPAARSRSRWRLLVNDNTRFSLCDYHDVKNLQQTTMETDLENDRTIDRCCFLFLSNSFL